MNGRRIAESDRTQPSRVVQRWGLLVTAAALTVLVVAASAASAEGPAAARLGARVPSAVDCQRLLARSPVPTVRPVELPGQTRLVDEVADFVESAPSGQRYVFPTADERARFQCGFQYAAARQLANATRLLDPFQYDVKRLSDESTPGGKRFILLEERKSRGRDGIGRYRRAWGLYVIALRTSVPVLAVEVPHPCRSTLRCNAVGGDRRTHTMAVTTFERAGAKYLFVAGTDRGATAVSCPEGPCSADVAHEVASMFEAVHEIALVPSLSVRAAARVYQPHGFVTTGHPPTCQEVVVSAGIPQDASREIKTTRLATRIAAFLNDDASDVYGRKVLLYGRNVPPPRDALVDCSPQDDPTGGLGATTNVQGRFARRLDPARDFVSVESSQNVRNLSAERDALSRTVGDVLGEP